MADLAFQSDELDLEEWERAGARSMFMQIQNGTLGRLPTASELIEKLRAEGKDDSLLAAALLLTLPEYRRVADVLKEVEAPRGPKIRRRR